MRLKALFEGVEYVLLCGTLDKDVNALIYHSDKAQAGAAFFALRGERSDGHDYIEALIQEGVEVFITEEYKDDLIKIHRRDDGRCANITVLKVKNTRKALALASKNFFGKPDERLKTVGITGTKGKTGTSYMLKAILEGCGIKTGIIGTVQQGFEGHYREAENTTPQSYEIYAMLREMVDEGCKAVIMEVSSQALMHHRTDGICFDVGIFTNLSSDHIGVGEHKSFEEYAYCKSRLFAQTRIAVINGDSPYADLMIENAECEKIVKFELSQAKNKEPFREGERLGMRFEYRGTPIELPVPGVFSIYNALAAMNAAEQLGIKVRDMAASLSSISIRGRTEIIYARRDLTVMLDYAHNGTAMSNLLQALRVYAPKELVVLFGCGGNRDRSRRTEMGKAAARFADFSVITSDNPREELPEEIIADIVKAVAGEGASCLVIPDRKKAIEKTVEYAKAGSIVAICGKGHETYQIIGNEKMHFDDREIINSAAEKQETEQ